MTSIAATVSSLANSTTLLNQIYLDPPKYGWTACGGIASILEPHELARRPQAKQAFLARRAEAAKQRDSSGQGGSSAVISDIDCHHYRIIGNDEGKQPLHTLPVLTSSPEKPVDDGHTKNEGKLEINSSLEVDRNNCSSEINDNTDSGAFQSVFTEDKQQQKQTLRAASSDKKELGKKDIRPKAVSIQRVSQEGIIDIYTYHRGRVGDEPRDEITGELLCQVDPVDTNHDWMPSSDESIVAKIVVHFPLGEDSDGEDEEKILDSVEGTEAKKLKRDHIQQSMTEVKKPFQSNDKRKNIPYFHEIVDWPLLDPTVPTPEEFSADIACKFDLNFHQTMELTESIQRQLDEYVRKETYRFFPPIVCRDPYGNERPDSHFGMPDNLGVRFSQGFINAAERIDGMKYIKTYSSGKQVIQRSTSTMGLKKSIKVRPMGAVKPSRVPFEVVPKDKVPKANEKGDEFAAEVLKRALIESQRIVTEMRSSGKEVLWTVTNEVCHICHNRKPTSLMFFCKSHSYCDYHCATRLSFRVHDYNPKDTNLIIDHCPVCSLKCTCSKCIRRLEFVANKLKNQCEMQCCRPDEVKMNNLIELCNSKLSSTPKASTGKPIPHYGPVIKKKTRDTAGVKRSRPQQGFLDLRSTGSSPSMVEVRSVDRSSKRVKLESDLPKSVLKINPTELPREMYEGHDTSPSEPGDCDRVFTNYGSFIPKPDDTFNLVPTETKQRYQDIIPHYLTNFSSCSVCKIGGKNLICCAECPRAYHPMCLSSDGSKACDLKNWTCERCYQDKIIMPRDQLSHTDFEDEKISEQFQELEGAAQFAPVLQTLMVILHKLKDYDLGNIFAEPVATNIYPEYLNVIKRPMDYGKIIKRLKLGQDLVHNVDQNETMYIEKLVFDILRDIEQVHHNCMVFNATGSAFYRAGSTMMTKWRAYYKQYVEEHLTPSIKRSLDEFRHSCKPELEKPLQLRSIIGPNPNRPKGKAIAVFDPDTMKILQQYTCKSSASKALLALKAAGYDCEHDFDERSVKALIDKSCQYPYTLIFGYHWIYTDDLKSKSIVLEEDIQTFRLSATSTQYNSITDTNFNSEGQKSPCSRNFVVLKKDSISGSDLGGFESEEAAYQDWLKLLSPQLSSNFIRKGFTDDIEDFRLHFLGGDMNINGIYWERVISDKLDPCFQTSPPLMNVSHQDYAMPVALSLAEDSPSIDKRSNQKTEL